MRTTFSNHGSIIKVVYGTQVGLAKVGEKPALREDRDLIIVQPHVRTIFIKGIHSVALLKVKVIV